MKNFFVTSLLVASFTSVALAKHHEATGADAQAINGACASDATTAGCGSEKVGTGLLKCLHAYKKAHKADFHFSDGCKSAMKTMHKNHKAGHGEHEG